MTVLSNSELIGKRVFSQDGRELGEIDSIYVDVSKWCVPQVGVKVRKDVLEELSLKRPFIGTQVIRIPTDQVSGATDTVVLKSELSELPFIGGKVEQEAEEEEAL